MPTVADVRYLEPTDLSLWMRQGCSSTGDKFMVVDVRDYDYSGGGVNIPSNTLGTRLPLLTEDVQRSGSKDIVFHCALSQQRGPSAAMAFLRYLDKANIDIADLKVWILRGGFTKWQELYGEDKSLTEGYNSKLWKLY